MPIPTLTAAPGTTPNRFGGDPAAFDAAMQAWLTWQGTRSTEDPAFLAWIDENTSTIANSADSVEADRVVCEAARDTVLATNPATNAAAAASSASAAAASAVTAAAAAGVELGIIAKSLHFGAIVKGIIYATDRDSDGGLCPKRCAAKSLYNETICGAWGGQVANVAAGWAACGSVAGGYYQNTTDGKLYAPTSVSTQTEVFRGNAREFPQTVAIVAETTRVVIYDLTQTGTPMVFVFVAAASNMLQNTITSVACLNADMLIGTSAGAYKINFISDNCTYFTTAANATYKGNLSGRNGANGFA